MKSIFKSVFSMFAKEEEPSLVSKFEQEIFQCLAELEAIDGTSIYAGEFMGKAKKTDKPVKIHMTHDNLMNTEVLKFLDAELLKRGRAIDRYSGNSISGFNSVEIIIKKLYTPIN